MKGHRFKTQPSLNQKDAIKEKTYFQEASLQVAKLGIITGGQNR